METNNNFIILPSSIWEGVCRDIAEIKQQLQAPKIGEESNDWLNSEEVKRMLGISSKTWQTYRDERRIPFSQFGRKIYVKKSDLNAFMESNKIDKDRDE